MKSILNEFELLEYSLCPLRVNGAPLAKHEYGARLTNVMSSLLLQAFNGSAPTRHEIIAGLDTVREFSKLNARRPKDPHTGVAYEARLRVAKALLRILENWRVIQPVTKYRLKIDRFQVDGEYALLQGVNRNLKVATWPTILQLRSSDIAFVRTQPANVNMLVPPNLVTYARVAHFMSSKEYPQARVLNLHIPSGDTWHFGFTEATARGGLEAAVRGRTSQSFYPALGAHCASCSSKECFRA